MEEESHMYTLLFSYGSLQKFLYFACHPKVGTYRSKGTRCDSMHGFDAGGLDGKAVLFVDG
jgi:hypothetical protein